MYSRLTRCWRPQAEDRVIGERKDKEYLPITGLGEFTKAAAVLAYGEDSKPLKEGRVRTRPNPVPDVRSPPPPLARSQVAITQSLSGTGALRIAGAFLARHYPHSKTIYLPAPTWGNHIPIFKDSGLEVKTYSYYDKNTVGLDFEGLKKDLQVRTRGIGGGADGADGLALDRPRRTSRLSSSTPARTTRPASTRVRSNGARSPSSSRRRSTSP